jgi:hypothetical protein
MIGSSRYDIDFIPTVFGRRLWLMEAKRPQAGEDLFSLAHIGQAWSYATDPRVAVPLMVLCDGVRLGIFDLTLPEWDAPVFDRPKEDIPECFDELRGASLLTERLKPLRAPAGGVGGASTFERDALIREASFDLRWCRRKTRCRLHPVGAYLTPLVEHPIAQRVPFASDP